MNKPIITISPHGAPRKPGAIPIDDDEQADWLHGKPPKKPPEPAPKK